MKSLDGELNVKSADTGYPIDFKTLGDEIGEDVEINGGVTVSELMASTPEQVNARADEILQSGILRGGRFVMKEANNVPPGMPLKNLAAVYSAVRKFGVYSNGSSR